MCGLIGLLTADGTAADRDDVVTEALRCARHRGPDETGAWHDDDIVLGFNRLAIIDVDGSHQPLRYRPPGHSDRYTIVFNGELYNYIELRAELSRDFSARFTTQGDTEVVVAAHHYWGPDAVRRFRGMFAYLIWDARRRVLFGARDPFGIKPLYLAHGPDGTAFASEKKSLLHLTGALGLPELAGEPHGDVDTTALQDYLQLQYVPEPASLHRSIRRIESGTRFTVRPGEEPVTERYFHPTFTGDRPGPTPRRIAAALRDSVAAHLRADVPVGAFLSGGVDSTAIVALAREHNPGLTTFTAAFERPGYSEAAVAAETADRLGVGHVVRTIGPEELTARLPLIIWYLDDPVADPALVPLWFVAEEARRQVTVVLSGEGADELFGGYSIYREPRSLAALGYLPAAARRMLGRTAASLPDGLRGKDMLRRGALSLERRYYGNARVFRDEELPAVLRHHDPARSSADITAPYYAESAGWDPVSRMQHVDLFTWLRGDILVKADKMTMAHGLELRVPFLDPEVFAVASGLTPGQKIHGSTTKAALREALAHIVPPHVLHRRKLGFPVPIRHWLRAEIHPWASAVIRDSGAGHLVDLAAVQALLADHRTGRIDHSRRIWALLVFLIWHGIFVERSIDPGVPEALGAGAAPVERA